jgi:hypothetical protein
MNDQALNILRELNSIIPLSDLVYRVRDTEGLGWDGPQVKAWGDACDKMRLLEQPEVVRVLGENWEGIYSDGKLLVQSSRLNARSILQALGYKVKTLITNKLVLPEELSDIYVN